MSRAGHGQPWRGKDESPASMQLPRCLPLASQITNAISADIRFLARCYTVTTSLAPGIVPDPYRCDHSSPATAS